MEGSEQDKINFGLAVSSVIAIVGVAIKILSKRISRSSCFGINVEMENNGENTQVQELQRVVAELTLKNAELQQQVQQRRLSQTEEIC